MPNWGEPLRVVKELPVPLTDAELAALGQQLAAKKTEKDTVEAEKRAANSGFNEQLKKIAEASDKLAAAINRRCETRAVDCEERRDLDTGELVLFRLDGPDPVEVSRKPYGEDERAAKDNKQPSLFDGKRQRKTPPPAPTLRCNAVNEDGEIFVISAEQADAADREIRESGKALLDVDGVRREVIKVVRGKACETCGIVGTHRPECAQMKREEAGKVLVLDVDGKELEVDVVVADDLREANRTGIPCPFDLEGVIYDLAQVKGEPVIGVSEDGAEVELTPQQVKILRQAIKDVAGCSITVGEETHELIAFKGMHDGDADADDEDYDRNDTGAVAAKISEGGAPPDGPVREQNLVPVKPGKKGKRGAKKGAASAEVEH